MGGQEDRTLKTYRRNTVVRYESENIRKSKQDNAMNALWHDVQEKKSEMYENNDSFKKTALTFVRRKGTKRFHYLLIC